MKKGYKRIRIFVGYQFCSAYYEIDDIKFMMEKLKERLYKTQNILLEVKFGELPVGNILWNEIIDSISKADITIFDISENNPNVMIEVGLSYGFKKNVLLLKNKESLEAYPKPSDLSGTIIIEYENKENLASEKILNALERGIIRFLKETHAPAYYFKELWGFGEYDEVLVVCSELDEPEKRQHPEPNEFIYLGKYGDVDALVETLITLHRLYPNLKVIFRSANEINMVPQELSTHIILIGGPDYNKLTRIFEKYSPFSYLRGEKEEDIFIKRKSTNEVFIPFVEDELIGKFIDYGFFVKMKNPYNPLKKLIMIGGAHTYGVFGAIKAFSYFSNDKKEISYQNCVSIIDALGNDPEFAILFKVESVGCTVLTPKVDLSNIEPINL